MKAEKARAIARPLTNAGERDAYIEMRNAIAQGPIPAIRVLVPLLFRVPNSNGQVMRPMPYQEPVIGHTFFQTWDHINVLFPTGLGKSQPHDAPILTPAGWTQMGDLRLGDEVVGADGKPCRVTGIFPQGRIPVFKVVFQDGSSAECSDDHLWNVATSEQLCDGGGFRPKPLREIRSDLRLNSDGRAKWRIPVVSPVQFKQRVLALDPYFLGVLIGDGTLSKQVTAVSSVDEEILAAVRSCLPSSLPMKGDARCTYRIVAPIGRKNPLREALRQLGLHGKRSWEKHVPHDYLFSSIRQRVALLQGLMDTDGTVRKDGGPQFSTSSPTLLRDFLHLIESLGCTAKVTTRVPSYTYAGEKRKGRLAYTVNFRCPPGLNPFRLQRKAALFRPLTKYFPTRIITDVQYVGMKESRCISVDSPDSLYVTDRFILTHNTYSAGIGEALRMFFQRENAVIIAPTEPQTNYIREHVHEFYSQGHDLLRDALLDSTKDEVRVRNLQGSESVLFCRTANINNEGKNLLGLQGLTTILLDERAEIPDSIYNLKINRITAPQDVRRFMLGITTTHTLNHVEKICEANALPKFEDCDPYKPHITKDGIAVFKTTWRDGVKAGRYSQDFIDDRFNAMAQEDFNCWYESEFPASDQTRAFPPDLIRSMLDGVAA